ncbi:MAG: hypothetical protein J0L52_12530 [Caulobacterales bacterium]|nr:hypothetical protein [Caulobacterales bacterium]
MQTFIDFLIGVVAALLTAILAQLGLDLDQRPAESREIHRTVDCAEGPPATVSTANQEC